MHSGIRFMLVESGEALDRVWPHVSGYLESALQHSLHSDWDIEQVWIRIQSGQFLLSVVTLDGVAVGAQVFDRGVDGKGRRFVGMICCGGFEMEKWLDGLVALCKKLCELHGAERIVVVGRRGWDRILYKYGVRFQSVIGGARTEEIVTPVQFEEL